MPVFTRGFIRAYCQALGESPDEALALYDGRSTEVATAVATAPPAAPVAAAPPRPPSAPAPVRRTTTEAAPRNRGPVLVSFILLVVLGVALFAVTLAPAVGSRVVPKSAAAVRVHGAARTVPPAAGTPIRRARGDAAPGSTAGSAPRRAPTGYRLVARAVETTWIRVPNRGRPDDRREPFPPGRRREWFSTGPFTLTVGNAGGVKLELNGRALPPLGPSGVVIPRLVLPTESQ